MRRRIKPNDINLKSFEYKKELNPKIWKDNKLKENIRQRLISIAKEFIDTTGLEIVPIDIVLVGSIASFNWSKYSDIDLHVIVDFKHVNDDAELVKNYLYAKKCAWNDKHKDLKIFGYDVELYAQDISEENVSNGVYSVKFNHWIKIPKFEHNNIKQDLVKQISTLYINKIEYYENKFYELKNTKSFLLLQSKVEYLYDLIIKGRRQSLPKEGEQAAGNIIFKVLRRSGHLGMLNDLKRKLFDKLNSIDENY
jgi:hypothetical protein